MYLNKIKIAVIGLGYVGLPLAISFSKKYNVIGYDLDKENNKFKKRNYETPKFQKTLSYQSQLNLLTILKI